MASQRADKNPFILLRSLNIINTYMAFNVAEQLLRLVEGLPATLLSPRRAATHAADLILMRAAVPLECDLVNEQLGYLFTFLLCLLQLRECLISHVHLCFNHMRIYQSQLY